MRFLASKQPQQMTRRRVAFAATLFLAGFGGLLFIHNAISTAGGVVQVDKTVLDWAFSIRSQAGVAAAQFFTDLLSPTFFSIAVVAGGIFWTVKTRDAWRPALLTGALGIALALTYILKDSVARIRPDVFYMAAPFETDPSFPSGHAVSAAVVGLVFWYLWASRHRSRRVLFTGGSIALGLILVGAFCRIYLGYHWLTDVSASILLACIVLAAVVLVDTLQPKATA